MAKWLNSGQTLPTAAFSSLGVVFQPLMLPFKLIYSDAYYLPIGEHVFPAEKYRLIHEQLLRADVAAPDDFLTPGPARDADVLLAHTPAWVTKLRSGTISPREELLMEVPYSAELVRAFWLAAGGSILAAQCALRDRVGISIGGGFHHAFADHGEGFCVINDIAIAIRKLQHEGSIARAMTVDCDVHHGNGTAAIFAADHSVFTLSIHQERNYPFPKPPSSLDINLHDGTEDEEYLAELEHSLDRALAGFKPDMIFYLAGADPYREDQLGGIKLSLHGLELRDRMVFEKARSKRIPVAVTLAGGYARRLQDTIQIHANTILVAKEFAA